MAKVPAKIEERISKSFKKYTKILKEAKARDINESDTVKIVYDMLHEVFGYEKYTEITSEYAIRGTFCDLAITGPEKDHIHFLVECKPVNSDLKDNYIRQATDYAAKEAVDWVILTNGFEWNVYKLIFEKPVSFELVFNVSFAEESSRDKKLIEKIFMLCKEALKKNEIEVFHKEGQIINKYTIGAVLQSPAVVSLVKKQLRSLSNNISVDESYISNLIQSEIVKREIVESDKYKNMQSKLKRGEKPKPVAKKEPIIEENIPAVATTDTDQK